MATSNANRWHGGELAIKQQKLAGGGGGWPCGQRKPRRRRWLAVAAYRWRSEIGTSAIEKHRKHQRHAENEEIGEMKEAKAEMKLVAAWRRK